MIVSYTQSGYGNSSSRYRRGMTLVSVEVAVWIADTSRWPIRYPATLLLNWRLRGVRFPSISQITPDLKAGEEVKRPVDDSGKLFQESLHVLADVDHESGCLYHLVVDAKHHSDAARVVF